MMSVLRLAAALALALPCIPAAGWLLLVCADFAGLDDCLSPQPGWMMFAAVSALAIALPPALHAWPDFSRPSRELAREGLRAALFSFALFAVAFLAGARPLFTWMNVPAPMTGMAAANLSLTFSCPLAFLSYSLSRSLLPRPGPERPAPPAMKRFGWLALALIALAATQPWLTGGAPLLFSSRLSLICAAWLIFALRMALRDHGEAGFVPMWGSLCLLFAFGLGRAVHDAGTADLAIAAVLLLLAAWSCACLLRRESRLWLC
ncbi:MAG: hypothetical protein IJD65_06515 [Mailhella sp.]|nr:hypothetical protein [Mailhella sp.]